MWSNREEIIFLWFYGIDFWCFSMMLRDWLFSDTKVLPTAKIMSEVSGSWYREGRVEKRCMKGKRINCHK